MTANESIGASAVTAIERLVLGTTPPVEIDGKAYSRVPLHDPRTEQKLPTPILLSSLSSLVHYLHHRLDAEYLREARGTFIHVRSPTQVQVLSEAFGPFLQRAVYVDCRAMLPNGFRCGEWYDQETLTILLQTHFKDRHDRARVLALIGNLSAEKVAQGSDDGFSQQVTVRAGVTRVGRVEVTNPVVLAPYRTFMEVEQPDSPFLLRLRGGGDGRLPEASLWECDGGAWTLGAVQRIVDRLEGDEALPGVPVIF